MAKLLMLRPAIERPETATHSLSIGQGIFYLSTGLWPVVSYRSFEKVTGPKTDDWLVKTVGLLIASAGTVMLYSGLRRRRIPAETVLLGAGQALVLGGVSLTYSLIGRISKVYLLDAAAEASLAAGWYLASRRTEEGIA